MHVAIFKLIAEPHCGQTVDRTAAALADIMRTFEIHDGMVIHNDRRYKVELHPPYTITPLDGKPDDPMPRGSDSGIGGY
jgi:hypothetical protein